MSEEDSMNARAAARRRSPEEDEDNVPVPFDLN